MLKILPAAKKNHLSPSQNNIHKIFSTQISQHLCKTTQFGTMLNKDCLYTQRQVDIMDKPVTA